MENPPPQEFHKNPVSSLFKGSITLIVITAVAFLFYVFGTIYLPGFKGRILDEETGLPIKDAYVVCFTDYYPSEELINVGGPNSFNDSMQITKTDENGYFKVAPYFKISVGWVSYRRIYLFKKGYIYAKAYYQYSKSKRRIQREAVTDGPLDKKSILFKTNDFHLSAFKADVDRRGNPFPNDFLGLLGASEDFHRYYKNEDQKKYRQFKPFFMQVYEISNTYSEEIKNTFLKPHYTDNWESTLKYLSEGLELGKVN